MKRITNLLVLALITVSLNGQITPLTNQYILNPMTINPAYAGSRSALSASVFYRDQWAGMAGGPATGTFCIDAPLRGERIGLGLMVSTDKIGVTKEELAMSNYAFRIDVGSGTLALGLGAGVLITNSKWSDLIVNDEGDDKYLVDSRTFIIPTFRFGMYLSYKNYFAGFSIPQFLSYRFDFDKNKYTLYNNFEHYNYLFTTGYLFKLNKNMSLVPSALLSYMPSERFRYDITAQVGYRDKAWLGASYSSNNTMTGIFRFQVNNQLGIGYCYDYDLGDLGKYNNGSHEIMIRYEFHYKVDAINPLIF